MEIFPVWLAFWFAFIFYLVLALVLIFAGHITIFRKEIPLFGSEFFGPAARIFGIILIILVFILLIFAIELNNVRLHSLMNQ